MRIIPEDTPEDNLDEVLTGLIERRAYDRAEAILQMVECTFSRYEEFSERLKEAQYGTR